MDKITTPEPMASDNRLGQRPQIISNGGPLMGGDDYLQLDATTTDATGSLTIRGRLLKLDGEIVDFNETLTFSGTGVQTPVRVRMTAGWLLGFAVYRASGTLTDGEVQAAVSVVRSLQSTFHPVMVLASGEVTTTRKLGMGAFLPTAASGGISGSSIATETVSDPAPGNPADFTVPAGEQWEVLSGNFRFATEAATGAGGPQVECYNGGVDNIWQLRSSALAGAGASVRVSFGPYAGTFEAFARSLVMFAVPRTILKPADVISYGFHEETGTITITNPSLTVIKTLV